MSEKTTVPTKVFISYSWDSEKHRERVLMLANTLRKPWGIETDIDQYVRANPPFIPPQGWDVWMDKRIEWAEFVLIVCTENYQRRFRGDEEPGLGRGVTWEGTIIKQNLYNNQLVNTKFIPVVFSSPDLTHVPIILNGTDKYVLEDERSFRELCYRLRKEPTLVIPEVSTGQLPSPPSPIFFTSPDLEAEPPSVLLDVAETLPRVPLKDIQDCDPGKILYIKNVKDPNPNGWAYSLEQMRQPESRTFELMWRASSHGVNQPKAENLMILHQRAKVTHIVEFLDDQVRETETGFFRWVRAVWLAEQEWNQLPHQKDILGFSPNYSDGNTHSLNSPNFSTFRGVWSSLEEFQKHIFRCLTHSEALVTDEDDLLSEKDVDYTRLRDLLKAGNWKEADQETADRMCEVMDRQQEGRLGVEDMQNFLYTDLRTIDQLWVKHSKGKFGFSVQKKIWQEWSPTGHNEQWEMFGEEVGWKKKGFYGVDSDWKSYSELTFDTSAPEGHLPRQLWEGKVLFGWWLVESLLSHQDL